MREFALLVMFLCLWIVTAPCSSTSQPADNPREAAVLRARGGDMEGAIAALRGLLAKGTNDPLVAIDLAVLLQQAGRPAEATAVYQQPNPADPPSYAIAAMVRAYRNQRKYDRAEALARQGLRRFPEATVWPLLLALVLTDGGRGAEALKVLDTPAARRAPVMERLLAQSYAAPGRRDGRSRRCASTPRRRGSIPGIRRRKRPRPQS